MQCAVQGCGHVIVKDEEYYLLGGGKVINCKSCACDTVYTIMVGTKEVVLRRGWDKVPFTKRVAC